MTVKLHTRGYANETYIIEAEENEILTKDTVLKTIERKAGYFFGYDGNINEKYALVKIYID